MSDERLWREASAENWALNLDRIEAVVADLGRRFMALVTVAPGWNVLDIGCGGGVTSRDLAAQVGRQGRVLGVDISEAVLVRARARGGDLPQLSYRQGDAEKMDLGEAAFDLALSRFGVMFFGDPLAAFRNIGHALKPGGALVFACWRALEQNPWFLEAMTRVAAEISNPPELPGNDGPGPFSMAGPEALRRLLAEAGFDEITIDSLAGQMNIGCNLEAALDFAMTAGPTRDMFAEATPEEAARARAALKALYSRHQGADGVAMPCKAWVVRAVRPR